MICDKCLKILNESMIGQKTRSGYTATKVKKHSDKQLFFKGYSPMFLLYIDSEKTTKEGRVMKKEVDQMFVSKFCPSCGDACEKI